MRNDLVGSPWQPNQSMPLTAYPILTFINIYNSYNRYLMKMLSAYPTSYALGARHIKNVVLPALIEVQDTVVEGGVVAYLQRVIKERFEFRAGDGNDEEQLAEAWFYWPITAGGLAITHPLITLNAISEGIKRESLTRVIRFEDMKRDPFGRARAVRDGVVYYGSEVTSRTAKKDNNNQDDQDNEEGGDEDADVAVEESSDDEDENKVEDEDDDDEEDYDDDNDVDVYQESDDEETIARAQANRDKEEQWWFVVDPDTLKPLRENESSAGTSPSTPQKEPMLLWVPRKWETETANYWGSQYSTLTDTADPMQPKKTGQLELLIEEFVDRGSDVRGSSSKKSAPITKSSWGRLGNYWKWIICTYSEQVLQMFGSLGLTSAQLIPLALISEIRKQSTMDL
ncbi:hypothetical protein BJ742DRAFT_423937 [Cladochytrium replicatum]|nr:hypothetical protein BJ742DRAFT_423937 [Cladochytrium replicatum]